MQPKLTARNNHLGYGLQRVQLRVVSILYVILGTNTQQTV